MLTAPLLFATLAAAQSAEPFEIRGTVIEGGPNHAIAGAEVTLATDIVTPEGIVTGRKELAKVQTGAQGDFRFEPAEAGRYTVKVAKEGDGPGGPVGGPFAGPPSDQATVTLTVARPSQEVHFTLVLPAELTGLLLDDATGEPLPQHRVYAFQTYFGNGWLRYFPGGSATTDDEGRFTLAVRPGSYVISAISPTGPSTDPRERSELFTEEEAATVDLDDENTYWPGGVEDLQHAQPVAVASGGSASVGTVRIRKVPYYRVRVSVTNPECEPPATVTIGDYHGDGHFGWQRADRYPCGQPALLRYFRPGVYDIEADQGRGREGRRRGFTRIVVDDENQDVEVTLQRGADVDVRFLTAEGAIPPPLTDVRLATRRVGGMPFGDEGPVSPDAEGRARIPNLAWGRQTLTFRGLPAGFYVKEIRYDGALLAGQILELNPGAAAHTLDVVIDDKPAALTGTVTDGRDPAGESVVFLTRWPASTEDPFLSTKRVTGDSDGRYQFTGLVPGDYRIFAVPSETASKVDEPGVLLRMLANAGKVTLAPATAPHHPLELRDPTR